MPNAARLQKLLRDFKQRAETSSFSTLIVGGYKQTTHSIASAGKLQSPLNDVDRFRADTSFGNYIPTEIFVTDITTVLHDETLLGDFVILWEPILGRLTKACAAQLNGIKGLTADWASGYKRIRDEDLAWWIGEITKIKESLSTYATELREEASQSSTALTLAGSSRGSAAASSMVFASPVSVAGSSSSVTVLAPAQQDDLMDLLQRHQTTRLFEGFQARVDDDPTLQNYFFRMWSDLSNLATAVKGIASGSIEGTNAAKHLIRLAKDASNTVLSLVGFPGIGALVGLLALGAETMNEDGIRRYGVRLSRFFVGQHENVTQALALVLTINQSRLICDPPSLTLTTAEKTYLKLEARFRGQTTYTEIDALVMKDLEKITQFFYNWPSDNIPRIENWLAELLMDQFSITLPTEVNPALIGKSPIASRIVTHTRGVIQDARPPAQRRLAPAPEQRRLPAPPDNGWNCAVS